MDLFSLVAKLTLDADDFTNELEKAEKAVDAFQVEEPDPLTLDTSEFDDNLEHSQELGSGFEEAMSTSFGNVANALKTAGIGLSLAAIVGQLKEMINMTAETADEIDKGASRLGISRKTYQEWDHALRQSGASINDLKKGLMNMQLAFQAADPSNFNDEIGKAEDHVDGLADKSVGLSQDAYDALRDLDMLGDLAGGKFASAEEIMDAALLKLAAFEGTKEDRGVLVRKLFGRGGDVLNDMLDEGYAGVKALMDEAENMGLIMSDEEIDNAVAYGDAVENLKEEMAAIQQAFVADIIPVLTDGVEWLTKLLELFNPRLRENSLADTFKDIDDATLKSGAKIDETGAKADALITKLAGMGDYWTLDEQGKKTWDALASEFIALEPEFEKYIDLENKAINGNTNEIKENIKVWEQREKQRLLDENTAKKREAVAQQYAKAEDKLIEAEVKEADANAQKKLAIDEVNEALKKNEELRNAVYGAYGVKSLNEENAGDILNFIHNQGFETVGMDAVGEFVKLNEQAESLRETANAMIDEADKAQAELEKYEEALSKRLKLTTDEVNNTTEAVKKLKRELQTMPAFASPFGTAPIAMPRAIGDSYIPYDNFPALLHRGERILTATENRNYNNGADFSGLEDRIEAAIRRGMDGAQVRSYLNGRDITDEVNRQNINAVKGRRFSG